MDGRFTQKNQKIVSSHVGFSQIGLINICEWQFYVLFTDSQLHVGLNQCYVMSVSHNMINATVLAHKTNKSVTETSTRPEWEPEISEQSLNKILGPYETGNVFLVWRWNCNLLYIYLYAEPSFIYEKPHRKECLCEKVLKWCFFCKTVNTGWLSHARGLEPKYLVCSHFKKHFLCEQLCESTSANVYQPATSMALVCIIKVHS